MKGKFDINSFQNLEKMERVERSENIDQLATIIRIVSGNPSLKVTTKVPELNRRFLEAGGKNPDNTWFYFEGSKTSHGQLEAFVHVPKSVLARTPEFAKGAAAHEGSHGKISRLSVIPEKVIQQTGFLAMMGSLEERPTDNYVRVNYGGGGRWIDITRKELELNGLANQETMQTMGYIPEYMQLCNMIVFAPNRHDKSNAYTSVKVLDAYEHIRKDVEKIENTLPAPTDDLDTVKELQFKRYEIAYLKIWPVIQDLLLEDTIDEMMRQMLVDVIRHMRQGDDTLLDKIIEGLSDDVRDEIKEVLQDIIEYLDEIEEEKKKQAEALPIDVNVGGMKSVTPGYSVADDAIPIAIDTFTEKMKKELHGAMDKLSPEKQSEYEEKAEHAFRDLDDIIARETISDLEPDVPESHASYDASSDYFDDKFNETEEDLKALENELKETKEKQKKAPTQYEAAYQEVREYEEQLYRELDEFFHPNQQSQKRIRSTGNRINLPAVFRWTAARKAGGGVIDTNIFEQRSRPEVRDYTFSLLVDMSGSMINEQRSTETFKSVVLLSEVLNRLGISFEVAGFNNWFYEIKSFNDVFTNEIRSEFDKLLYVGGATETSRALRRVSEGLEKIVGKEKIILCMTDGQAYAAEIVKHIVQDTDQKLIGIGIGQGTDSVTNDFPVSIPNVKPKDLATVLSDLLRTIFKNPTQLNE